MFIAYANNGVVNTELNLQQDGVSVVLVVGVNGVGKTTSIAKLCARYKKKGHKVLLAAADTFRAGAVSQLKIWAEKVGVDIVCGKENSDPSSVIYDATTTGQNGVLQAKAFFDAVHVTGIVLTKMDSTSKGGIILAIKDELNIPVKFVCFGEKIDDIEDFDLDNYLYGLTKGMEE